MARPSLRQRIAELRERWSDTAGLGQSRQGFAGFSRQALYVERVETVGDEPYTGVPRRLSETMLILSPEDRAALWHKAITSEPDSRDGMLRVLAKEIQDLVGSELGLYDFDEQLEHSIRLLDASGFLGRDDLRSGFEEIGEEADEDQDSAARFALTLAGYLEQTADVDRLTADDRVAALELALAWREAVADAHAPGTEKMSVAEVASHFDVTPQAVYKWCQAGKIDFERRPGGSYRIPAAQFDLERGRATRRAREDLKRRLLERYGDRPSMSDDEVAAAIEAARRRSTG